MTREDVMRECELDEDEFDDLYTVVLDGIRQHGTRGVSKMLAFVEQELNEGREDIE